ncbi:MAG: glycosyltransferase family 2 protein, partial [Chloroflexota bacterium]|nr:glycosyltransferase family 2 protein [Chloroflexota bacterium]
MQQEDMEQDQQSPPVTSAAAGVAPKDPGAAGAIEANATAAHAQLGDPLRPTCSVIIPVHNKASLTRHCLNTILAQDDAGISFEIIIVDDGSDDLT